MFHIFRKIFLSAHNASTFNVVVDLGTTTKSHKKVGWDDLIQIA